MVLKWEVNKIQCHFFDVYRIKSPTIIMELMVNKETNLVDSSSVIIEGMVFAKFPDLNGQHLEAAKRHILRRTMEFSDYLIADPRNSHLPQKSLQEDFANIFETYMLYKAKQQLDKPDNTQTVEVLTHISDADPLANDERVV